MMIKICSVVGCKKTAKAVGMCHMHYARMRKGAALDAPCRGEVTKAFLFKAASSTSSECIFWPFARNNMGYGEMSWEGKHSLVHRVSCTLAHGPSPVERPNAAHECGNGHLGCINGKHLRWASVQENHDDMRRHGTVARGFMLPQTKLSELDILDISVKSMMGEKASSLAKEYGVSRSSVYKVRALRMPGILSMPSLGPT